MNDTPPEKKSRRSSTRLDTSDRLPPHSIEAEQGVLGCILLSPAECLDTVTEKVRVRPEIFYDLRHQRIWTAMLKLHEMQLPIDEISLMETLRNSKQLEDIGGIVYLATLADAVPSANSLDFYLGTVFDKYLRRQAIAIYTEGVRRAYDDTEADTQKLLLEVESNASALTETQSAAQEKHIKDVMDAVITDMEQWHYMRGKTQLRGLPTGPNGNYLDKILLGIREKHYVVIAGRPGEGKSSLAMNIVEYLAKEYEFWDEIDQATYEKLRQQNEKKGKEINRLSVSGEEGQEKKYFRLKRGIPIAVFTIEMDNESLGYRLLFGRAGVDEAEWNQGYSREGDLPKLTRAAGELAGCQIWLDDTPGQSIGRIAAKARRMARQYGIKLFVLDYIQLVDVDGANGMDRVKELTKISAKIMALKKQLGIPWIVLAQMNRNIETTEGKRPPILSDLKDCGAIEQDADKIMFIYKPDRKEIERNRGTDANPKPSDKEVLEQVTATWDWSKRPYRMNVLVAKNRRGPKGAAEFVFSPNLCRFEDFRLWKVKHGVEDMKAGETKKGLGIPTNEELGMG